MKKLLIVMTLFTSSFFLFLEDVDASLTHNFSDYSLVLSEEFKNVQSISTKLFSTLDYQAYVILYNSNDNVYIVWFFNDNQINFKRIYDSGYYYALNFAKDINVRYNYDFSINELVLEQEFTYVPDYSIHNIYFLYSTVDIKFKYFSNPGKYIYNTPDFSKTYSSQADDDSLVPPLFDICVESGNCSAIEEENPHKEELEKVSNFYTVVIDKLVYLSEVIVSNYIYLSIIVIFMLVFLFKLIFRRYL